MKKKDLGKELRDIGMARVSNNSSEWHVKAYGQVVEYAKKYPGKTVTGEMLRTMIVMSAGQPHHLNAWGALIAGCVKRNMFTDTGKTIHTSRPISHSRRIVVWEINKASEWS